MGTGKFWVHPEIKRLQYKVVIWGIGKEYEKNRNVLCFEEYKGNLEVVVMVSRDKYANYLDKHKIISKYELGSMNTIM